ALLRDQARRDLLSGRRARLHRSAARRARPAARGSALAAALALRAARRRALGPDRDGSRGGRRPTVRAVAAPPAEMPRADSADSRQPRLARADARQPGARLVPAPRDRGQSYRPPNWMTILSFWTSVSWSESRITPLM